MCAPLPTTVPGVFTSGAHVYVAQVPASFRESIAHRAVVLLPPPVGQQAPLCIFSFERPGGTRREEGIEA
ncbi:hypothetical protein CCHR01_08105 [Colletotrichum chrysophilum]|uniref:Uncharacterized protein n=1 Tax=Colletotrichum chrysophilum TaxID=1836956 RepID=A0AAD9ELU1_9PEZI|nr:hypothetical protein CCHR01_08105 [Colletotrichum chrysophilum]